MARRLALFILVLLCLAPAICRRFEGKPRPRLPCTPEGRGVVPRHWIGCSTDGGPRRELTGRERLILGLLIDLNRAEADDLATVPGLSPRLAAAIVEDRASNGPFPSVDSLLRVRGIGPTRLARARAALSVGTVAKTEDLR